MTRAILVTVALALAVSAQAATQPVLPVPAPLWPTPVVRKLDNGLTVAVFRQPRLPIVQIQLALPAGFAAEDSARLGVAALTASMLRAGTTSRSSEQFQQDLDQVGAVFNVAVTRDQAVVTEGLLATDFETGLELFSDAVINPVFPIEEFELARRAAARQLGQSRANPTGVVDERAWMAAFAPHPYGRPITGSLGRILQLDRDRMQEFHRDHWRPDHAVLVIAGDVESERALSAASEWFGRWSGRAVAGPAPADARPRQGRVVLVDMPGAIRSEVRLVQVGPGRRAAESAAWGVLAEALGASDRFSGAQTNWSPLDQGGLFSVAANVSTDSVLATVSRLSASWRTIASDPPKPEACAAAASRLRAQAPLGVETLGGLASTWQSGWLAGLGDDHLAGTAARIDRGAAPEAVASVATSFAAPPVIVVSGPAAQLRDGLARFGDVEVQAFDLEAEALARQGPAPATPEQLRRGRELVDGAVLAHGGAAALNAVRSIVTAGTLVIRNGEREVQGSFEQVRVEPYRMSYLTRILEFQTRQVLDGERAWATTTDTPPKVTDADSVGVAGLRTVFESDFLHTLRFALADSASPTWRGSETTGATTVDHVEFTLPSGHRARLVIDARTHRVTALETAVSPDGVWHERRAFSDFRQAGKLWLPWREERSVEGELVNAFRLRSLLVDPPIDPKLFRKPDEKP